MAQNILSGQGKYSWQINVLLFVYLWSIVLYWLLIEEMSCM